MIADTTLFQVSLVFASLSSVAWIGIGGNMKLLRGASVGFSGANLLFGVAIWLLMGRTPEASYFRYQGVEWLILLGFSVFHFGILALVEPSRSPPAWRRVFPIVLAVGWTAIAAPDPSSFQTRATAFSVAVAWLSFECALSCWHGLHKNPITASARNAIITPFFLLTVLMSMRATITLLFPPATGDQDFVQVPAFTPFLWVITILVPAINMSLAGLVAARLLIKITSIAERDYLTGCLNRRALEARLKVECERSHRHDEPLTCVFIDLDKFKRINDTYGHEVGDEVIRHVAMVTQLQIRSMDTLGRYGGDEFLILMPATNLAGASDAAERIRGALCAYPVRMGSVAFSISASFGTTVLGPSETATELLARVDQAMYQAKRLGGDHVKAIEEP